MHCAIAPQVLELETTGRFTVEAVRHESNRCGQLGSTRTLAFRVRIDSAPEHLNEQGFLIDWRLIHAYFAENFRQLDVFPSCERIACQACSDIAVMLGRTCSSIEVTIGSGERPAGMKARWVRPSNF